MKKNEIEVAEKFLCDPFWRINSLCDIVNKQGYRVRFSLNWAQQQLYNDIWYCNIILKARQLGFTTEVCIIQLDLALFHSKQCALIAHTLPDAERLFRNKTKYA